MSWRPQEDYMQQEGASPKNKAGDMLGRTVTEAVKCDV